MDMKCGIFSFDVQPTKLKSSQFKKNSSRGQNFMQNSIPSMLLKNFDWQEKKMPFQIKMDNLASKFLSKLD